MKFNDGKSENSSLAEINIIPLVDIMLVLLIIFMVAAPMMQEGISIDLPEVSAESVDVSQEDFILSVDDAGQIFINENKNDKFSIVSIEEKLQTALKDKKEKVVYLRADQTLKYGYIMEVMAACRRAGIEKIGMITHTDEDEDIQTKEFKTTSSR